METNKMCFNFAKKTLFIGMLMTGLAACSSEITRYPQKVSQNIRAIPDEATLAVTAQSDVALPEDGQTVAEERRYEAINDVYNQDDNKILIPSGAIIRGKYTNNGVYCAITWEAIYAHDDKNESNRNAIDISRVTEPTLCDPKKVIKYGDRVIINFTGSSK